MTILLKLINNKDKTNNKLRLPKVDTKKKKGIKMVQHF